MNSSMKPVRTTTHRRQHKLQILARFFYVSNMMKDTWRIRHDTYNNSFSYHCLLFYVKFWHSVSELVTRGRMVFWWNMGYQLLEAVNMYCGYHPLGSQDSWFGHYEGHSWLTLVEGLLRKVSVCFQVFQGKKNSYFVVRDKAKVYEIYIFIDFLLTQRM